ncbi:sensor histidine kinase [Marinicrinis lubricantis]|uniref:Sensor histidine kinase n=1 Tax=Marinicrinis lubricantis TaxID=2086470 RepID=A0ABW1IW14_9BACL
MLKISANSIRKSIFIRLVITHLFVILPLILLGIYLYHWSHQNASQEISRNMQAQLSYYLKDLNREMEWLEIQQFDLLQDSGLNELAVTWGMMDSVEKKEKINNILSRLNSIKSSSAYIQDIYLHIRSINRTISAVQGLQEFEKDRFEELRSGGSRDGGRLMIRDDSLHLSVSKWSGRKGEEPLFIVEIELNMERLKDSLRQISMYPESSSFLISETSKFTLASTEQWADLIPQYIHAADKETDDTFSLDAGGKKYQVNRAHSDELGFSVVTYLPEETVSRPLSKFTLWAWLFSVTSIGAIVIYAYSTYKFVRKPLLFLIQSFRRMEEGALNVQIQHEQKDEFGYLYHRFNQMLTKLQNLIDQDYKQKLMMQKAELKQLQSQINPHFLYNSFFILNSLAKTGDVDRIELFTNMLGEYFRFITRNGEDEVCLKEEIKHSRMYTEIQKLRFSRRIQVQFDELPVEMEQIRVPRLIIQPIIENAYEHSLEKMPDEGFLRVTFDMKPREADIIVEDNGNLLDDAHLQALSERFSATSESQEMTGMVNIHRRIVLTYGEGSGLFLSRSVLGGLQVLIRIKQKEEN